MVATPRIRLHEAPTAIRPYERTDLDALLALRKANRDFLGPYEAVREDPFFTRAAQARELALDADAWNRGAGFAFAILEIDAARPDDPDHERLIGRVALANVVRGLWLNATLGYWVDESAGGCGHATRAVRLATRFAFEHAGLHRIQPAVMPRNTRSARVLTKAGFRLEGRALRYLRIAGTWEDHDLYALTREEWAPEG